MFTTIVALVVMVWWGATSVASGAISTGSTMSRMSSRLV